MSIIWIVKKEIKHIELLAPAGNFEALRAAVMAGADAVYLGLDVFNARRGADNFTMSTLKDACEYAHLRGAKIFLTLNIIIFEKEFKSVINLAIEAANAGVDAFIVQDLGLAKQLTKVLPEIELHVSTQMNIHNTDGIDACALLGAKRVTLARELTIEEIEHLCDYSKRYNIDIEVFGHGAICICYSGQCLMSSMIGGRSANRGTCAQACRLNYELKSGSWVTGNKRNAPDEKRGEYLLSPKDLCTIDILPRLFQSGIRSLKIEGRMKSPDYVYEVVSVYRKAINKLYDNNATQYAVDDKDKQRLAQAFSRGFTTAYMEFNRGNDMMSYRRPNNRGVNIGRVLFASSNKLEIDLKKPVKIGDVIEVWTKQGKISIVIDSKAKISKSKAVIFADKKSNFKTIRNSDRVFKLRSASEIDFSSKFEPKIPVRIDVDMKLGKPLKLICCTKITNKEYKEVVNGEIVERAKTKAVTKEDVEKHIGRLGQTDFYLDSIKIDLDDNVGIGFSALHHIRQNALDLLKAKICNDNKKTLDTFDKNICMDKILYVNKSTSISYRNTEISIIATNPEIARLAKRKDINKIYVPLLNFKRGWSSYAGKSYSNTDSAGYPNKHILMLPTVCHDSSVLSLENKKKFYLSDYLLEAQGKTIFCDSVSSVIAASKYGATIEIGPHIPLVNSYAIDFIKEYSVSKIWLSPELSLSQIQTLTSQFKDIDFGIYVLGAQELMITEHCELMSLGECFEDCQNCKRRQTSHYLLDRKAYEFPVVTDVLGRSHIYNSTSLDLCHTIKDLFSAGISSFMIDASLLNKEDAAQAIVRLKKSLSANTEKIKKTTTGHIFKKVL